LPLVNLLPDEELPEGGKKSATLAFKDSGEGFGTKLSLTAGISDAKGAFPNIGVS
jgi:hypothetical protein